METLDKNEDIKEKIFESLIPVKVENCPRAVHNTQFKESPNSPTGFGLFVFCSFKHMIQKAIHRHCFSDPEVFSSMSFQEPEYKAVEGIALTFSLLGSPG